MQIGENENHIFYSIREDPCNFVDKLFDTDGIPERIVQKSMILKQNQQMTEKDCKI